MDADINAATEHLVVVEEASINNKIKEHSYQSGSRERNGRNCYRCGNLHQGMCPAIKSGLQELSEGGSLCASLPSW
jgi:hypothetical protein